MSVLPDGMPARYSHSHGGQPETEFIHMKSLKRTAGIQVAVELGPLKTPSQDIHSWGIEKLFGK